MSNVLPIEELITILASYNLEPYPLTKKQGVCYSYVPFSNNGTIEQAQFEITIVNEDLLACYKAKAEIDKLLITLGDESLTHTITSCTQSGGGQYRDNDLGVYKVQANYAITARLY